MKKKLAIAIALWVTAIIWLYFNFWLNHWAMEHQTWFVQCTVLVSGLLNFATCIAAMLVTIFHDL